MTVSLMRTADFGKLLNQFVGSGELMQFQITGHQHGNGDMVVMPTLPGPLGPNEQADQGFSLSVTMSPTTIRYLSLLLGGLALPVACWYAPDAAVLAGKLKAIWEVVKQCQSLSVAGWISSSANTSTGLMRQSQISWMCALGLSTSR